MASQARIKGKSGLGPPQINRGRETHVSNVMTPKGNQTTLGIDSLRGHLRGISASGDEHLLTPNLPQEVVGIHVIAVVVIGSSDTWFGNVKVGEVGEPLFGLRDEVGEGGFGVLHLHSLPYIPWRDAESYSVLADDAGDSFDDFEREPRAVLNRSTIFVCPLVRDVLEELIWEVSVGAMDLDAVESSSVDRFVSGVGVPLGVGLDFCHCQRARDRVGRRHGDGGCADQFEAGVLGLE